MFPVMWNVTIRERRIVVYLKLEPFLLLTGSWSWAGLADVISIHSIVIVIHSYS